ncbi:MAG: hypothetical protein R3B13_01060 [Polyangiaceae bacterium]
MRPRQQRVLERYLERYAEPEIVAARMARGRWDHVLVVPALAESPSFVTGFLPALASAPGRALMIVVVNARVDSAHADQLANRHCVEELSSLGALQQLTPSAALVNLPEGDLLLVDRGEAPRLFPRDQGVGLARKIGADIALALQVGGQLDARMIGFSDADAQLPRDYFARLASLDGVAIAAFPFVHTPAAEHALEQASQEYELWLRYYVLGLAWAESPFAMHTIGSTLAIDVATYAHVRGVPKRLAGEDFHLVNKALKIGAGRRLRGAPVELEARRSTRVPFGTGPALERLESAGPMPFAHPEAFSTLLHMHQALFRCSTERSLRPLDAAIQELAAPVRGVCAEFFAAGSLRDQLQLAVDQCATLSGRLARTRHNFDGLQTWRLLRRLRDDAIGAVGWSEAVQSAPFLPGASSNLRDALAQAERCEANLAPQLAPLSSKDHRSPVHDGMRPRSANAGY